MPQVSSIERELSKEQHDELKEMVRSKNWTAEELVEIFAERGFVFSSTAMGLHKKKILDVAEGFEKSRMAMEVFAEKLGKDYSSSEQGEMLVNALRTLTFDCMATQMEDGKDVDPKTLETLAKVIKNAAGASRLSQDHADKERERIQQEEREKAADSAVEVMTEAGINLEQVEFFKKKFLGVREPHEESSK